jgi:outer membrane protein OmpA-like peptidoglycan-associated protein
MPMKSTLTILFAALLLAACGSRQRREEQIVHVVQPAPTCNEQWVHMPMLLNFPTGGTQLDVQSREILQELVASGMSRTDLVRVRVEGHTDDCGSEANNMVLSEQRAVSVANEMVTMGVPRERIETLGLGNTVPRAGRVRGQNCGQDLTDATNRRVEFTLLVCRQ